MLDSSNKVDTILFAEDDEDDQQLITLAFNTLNTNHHLQMVSNGREALKVLMQESYLPCLIVLDLNMPVLNGFQTLDVLNADQRFVGIPKIILTTSDSEENKSKSFSKGAAAYFVKPSRMGEIVNTIQKILKYC